MIITLMWVCTGMLAVIIVAFTGWGVASWLLGREPSWDDDITEALHLQLCQRADRLLGPPR